MKHGLLRFMVFILIVSGCDNVDSRLKVDVSGISVPETRIHRYDLDLFSVNPAQLQEGLIKLRPEYPFFLDTDLNDPEKLSAMDQYLNSPRNREFYQAVSRKYSTLSDIEQGLTGVFKHLRYYSPGFKPPRVYTYISGGDYDYPIQFADSVLLIGLDNYLGKDFKPYTGDGLPSYRIARMEREFILADCIHILTKTINPAKLPGNTLLEQVVEAGKQLYLARAMAPDIEPRLLIGYSQNQYNWIVKNEKHVWAAIISNRMLYATDGKLIRAFMADGPFTSEFSKDSPPRLGEWLGWQIVNGYMANQKDVNLNELVAETDAQKILSGSAYKPGQ